MWMPVDDFYWRIFFRVPGIGGVAGRVLANFFDQKAEYSLPIAVCLDHVDFYFAIRMQLLTQKIKVKDTSSLN